jgi:hypothetical protein
MEFEEYEELLRRAGVRRSPGGSLLFDQGAFERRTNARAEHTIVTRLARARSCSRGGVDGGRVQRRRRQPEVRAASGARLHDCCALLLTHALTHVQPAHRSERSAADDAAAGFLTSRSRSRRHVMPPEAEVDDLGLLVCDEDLELIAGEVDFHTKALKSAVTVRARAAITRKLRMAGCALSGSARVRRAACWR